MTNQEYVLNYMMTKSSKRGILDAHDRQKLVCQANNDGIFSTAKACSDAIYRLAKANYVVKGDDNAWHVTKDGEDYLIAVNDSYVPDRNDKPIKHIYVERTFNFGIYNEELQRLRDENKKLKSQIDDLEDENADLEDKISQLNDDYAELEDWYDKLVDENAGLEDENAELRDENASLKNELEQLKKPNYASQAQYFANVAQHFANVAQDIVRNI